MGVEVAAGADGLADMFAMALTLGGRGVGLARQLLSSMNQNGVPAGGSAGVNGVPVEKVAVEKVQVDRES